MEELKEELLEGVTGGTDTVNMAGSSWVNEMLKKAAKKAKELVESGEYEKRNS